MDKKSLEPFQRFEPAPKKPLKRFHNVRPFPTQLKQGVNDKSLARLIIEL